MSRLPLLLLLLPGLVFATDSGVTLKADQLRAEPYSDASISGNFIKGEPVTILNKQGAWLQIRTVSNHEGWVRLLAIRRGSASSSGSSADSVLNLASGRAGTGSVVATTGIRGLSESELKAAKYSAEGVKKLESYTVSASDGQGFASAGGLKAAKFPYLTAGGEK